MGEDDALGRAGGAGGVDDQGGGFGRGGAGLGGPEVPPGPAGADGTRIRPRPPGSVLRRAGSAARPHVHVDPGQVRKSGGQVVLRARQNRGGGAVAEDVRQLPLPGARVERDRRYIGQESGHHRDRRPGGRCGPDGDPPRAPDPCRQGPGGLGQFLVRQGVRAEAQCGSVRAGHQGREERAQRSSSSRSGMREAFFPRLRRDALRPCSPPRPGRPRRSAGSSASARTRRRSRRGPGRTGA